VNGVEQLIAFMWGTLLLLLGWFFYIVKVYEDDDTED
jgi:hypothetical protein